MPEAHEHPGIVGSGIGEAHLQAQAEVPERIAGPDREAVAREMSR
jgi:hypothetical protein